MQGLTIPLINRSPMLGLIGLKGSKFGNNIDPEHGMRTIGEPDRQSNALHDKHEGHQEEADSIASLKERVSLS